MTTAVFPFRFHPLFAAADLALGVREDTCSVQVADDGLAVDFGPWKVRTPLANVVGASVTGPSRWPKAMGPPPHLSLADRGLTFATNPHEGVCVRFEHPIRGIDPWGVVRHPALTVTVAEPAALAELLDRVEQRQDRESPLAEPSVEELIEAAHDELMSLSAAELRRRARDRGIGGVSRRSKAELVALLEPVGPGPDGAVAGASSP